MCCVYRLTSEKSNILQQRCEFNVVFYFEYIVFKQMSKTVSFSFGYYSWTDPRMRNPRNYSILWRKKILRGTMRTRTVHELQGRKSPAGRKGRKWVRKGKITNVFFNMMPKEKETHGMQIMTKQKKRTFRG